jgi:hypothetical protein
MVGRGNQLHLRNERTKPEFHLIESDQTIKTVFTTSRNNPERTTRSGLESKPSRFGSPGEVSDNRDRQPTHLEGAEKGRRYAGYAPLRDYHQ